MHDVSPLSGPVTEDDVAWWFGWTKGRARAALGALDLSPQSIDFGPRVRHQLHGRTHPLRIEQMFYSLNV